MLRALHHLMRPGNCRRRRPGRWRSPLEALEGRAVPAGDVSAVLFGSTLFLTGDELDNSIQFHPGDQPGQVVVHGVNTTVNGSKQPATFTGVQAIEADLGG